MTSSATDPASRGETPARYRSAPQATIDASSAPQPNGRATAGPKDRGVEDLAFDELCVLVSGAGSEARRALGELISAGGIAAISRANPDHLRRLAPLSRAQSSRLAAAFALGRRVESARTPPRPDLRSPARVHELLLPELRGLLQETFHVLLLDGKHRLRRRERISTGTLTSSLVHPREVFGPALREAAAALVVAHNHPSGDPEPSSEDLAVTRRLIEAGRLVGVPLLDHVVVAEQGYVSIRERIAFD